MQNQVVNLPPIAQLRLALAFGCFVKFCFGFFVLFLKFENFQVASELHSSLAKNEAFSWQRTAFTSTTC